jgi:hypothetical protein
MKDYGYPRFLVLSAVPNPCPYVVHCRMEILSVTVGPLDLRTVARLDRRAVGMVGIRNQVCLLVCTKCALLCSAAVLRDSAGADGGASRTAASVGAVVSAAALCLLQRDGCCVIAAL